VTTTTTTADAEAANAVKRREDARKKDEEEEKKKIETEKAQKKQLGKALLCALVAALVVIGLTYGRVTHWGMHRHNNPATGESSAGSEQSTPQQTVHWFGYVRLEPQGEHGSASNPYPIEGAQRPFIGPDDVNSSASPLGIRCARKVPGGYEGIDCNGSNDQFFYVFNKSDRVLDEHVGVTGY
jgi:hypothetical protein